jgi:hypothetical protein
VCSCSHGGDYQAAARYHLAQEISGRSSDCRLHAALSVCHNPSLLSVASLGPQAREWSEPEVITIASRASRLADARRRQAALIRHWSRTHQEVLARMEEGLSHASEDELQAEHVHTTPPLGHLLQPHADLGSRSLLAPEEQHAHSCLSLVAQQAATSSSIDHTQK